MGAPSVDAAWGQVAGFGVLQGQLRREEGACGSLGSALRGHGALLQCLPYGWAP